MKTTAWLGSLLCAAALPLSANAAGPLCNEPNVLVVFDVSGSMGLASNATSKYTQATTALVGSTTSLDNEIRFGLLMFPKPSGQGCDLDVTPQISFALNNGPVFDDLLLPGGATFWGGPTAQHDTPMFQALSASAALTTLQTADRRGYVLLITDGSQDCCISGDYDTESDCLPASTTLDPVEGAENVSDISGVITGMAAKGIRTFVVGFGSKVNALGLNKMAVAGTTAIAGCNPDQTDGAAADNCYYNASNGTGLTTALAAVTKIVTEESCDGQDNDCDGSVDEDYPALGQLCDGGDADLCELGEFVCSVDTKSVTCDEFGSGLTELCDGEDNDCDGQTDEDFPGLGSACDGTDGDTCAAGELVCSDSGFSTECIETGVGIVELCDEQDNDCDGKTDEGFADLGAPCDGPDIDSCKTGVIVCSASGKSTECDESLTGGVVEACNGTDDDCDSLIDEGTDEDLCGPKMRCASGVCVGEETDLPGDVDTADAGSLPDANDNPLNGEDTSGTDQPANDTTGGTDQPATDTSDSDVGISVPDDDLGTDVSGGGANTGGQVAASTDTGGCGCRTLTGQQSLPMGSLVGLALVALSLLGLRRR